MVAFFVSSPFEHGTFLKENRKKPEKKEKRKPLISEDFRGCQGFLEKYYLTEEGGDFFKNP